MNFSAPKKLINEKLQNHLFEADEKSCTGQKETVHDFSLRCLRQVAHGLHGEILNTVSLPHVATVCDLYFPILQGLAHLGKEQAQHNVNIK